MKAFITIGDRDFYKILKYQARQLEKFYPESDFIIYNWGLTEKQIEKLRSHDLVSIKPWSKKFVDIEINFQSFRQKLKVVYGIWKVKNLFAFLKNNWKALFATNHEQQFIKREILFANKVLVLEDAIKQCEQVVYLDADTLVIESLDNILNDTNADIGLTIRKNNEINLSIGECAAINAGIVFLLGGKEKNEIFIEKWKKKMMQVNEYLSEQTALTRLLQEYCGDKPVTRKTEYCSIKTRESNIKVKILPCEVYNYNWIEEFLESENDEDVKILHFKSGRFKTNLFNKTLKKIDL